MLGVHKYFSMILHEINFERVGSELISTECEKDSLQIGFSKAMHKSALNNRLVSNQLGNLSFTNPLLG